MFILSDFRIFHTWCNVPVVIISSSFNISHKPSPSLPVVWHVNAWYGVTSSLMSDKSEGLQIVQEYSSLLSTIICHIRRWWAMAQVAILLVLLTFSLIRVVQSELGRTPRSFTLLDGRITFPDKVLYCRSSAWQRKSSWINALFLNFGWRGVRTSSHELVRTVRRSSSKSGRPYELCFCQTGFATLPDWFCHTARLVLPHCSQLVHPNQLFPG